VLGFMAVVSIWFTLPNFLFLWPIPVVTATFA
jgi:hypothetical protein